jgi:FkbM family methyltransferase
MIENFIKHIENKNQKFIIFDIGSRDCIQSIEFYNAFPNSKIYAFECNPNTLDICKINIAPYSDRITLIEGAVCDYDGNIKFYPINQQKTITTWKDGNPGASSIFKSNGQYTYETYVQDEIITQCHRLDSIMNKYGISNVDIIWMNLQGAELLALKGLGNHLQNVKYIYTEVSYKEMYSGQVMFNELNNFILSNEFSIINNLTLQGWQEDVIYEKNDLAKYEETFISHQKDNELKEYVNLNDVVDSFDIVIPIGPNDKDIIIKQIEYTKKNIVGYRNIYLICYDPNIIIDGCITINENIFPFSLETVSNIHGKSNRNGWYLQQLLKLYALITIPEILERCLIIDSDTFFLKPTIFINNNKCLYNYGTEYHIPYFEHMLKMDEDLIKIDKTKSGICHHMMFEKIYINELINKIEEKHNDKFYNVFLKMVTEITGSGASEYEIYFNYMLKNYSNKINIRKLNFTNSDTLDINTDVDYISCHWYMRL